MYAQCEHPECKQSSSATCLRQTTRITTYGPEQRPYCCPVCGGRGIVQGGFYNLGGVAGGTLEYEECRSCGGKGYIWR